MPADSQPLPPETTAPRARGRRGPRRPALLGALALLVLAGAASLGRARLRAQSTDVEQHTGTFSIGREQTVLGVILCYIPEAPYMTGTLEFTIDHRNNSVSGTLSGAGAAGWTGTSWDTFVDDSGRTHYRSFTTAKCSPKSGSGPDYYVAYEYRATIQATLEGSYNPDTGAIQLNGDPIVSGVIHPIDCTMYDDPTFEGTVPAVQCGDGTLGGVNLADAIRSGQDLPISGTSPLGPIHLTLTGQRFNSGASGGMDLTPHFGLSSGSPGIPDTPAVVTSGTWTTSFTVAATPTATPTATATAAPAPQAPPGPSGPPPTVCDLCPDQDWAQQEAASWAWVATGYGVIYSGNTSTVATADQIAASQQQLQQCLVSGIAAERQKPPAQQQTRQQVYNTCKATLPVQLPVG